MKNSCHNGMKRIIVIGSPGAGKSTFAKRLRDDTGLPLYYLDIIWHLPDKTNISREEFDKRLMEILATEEWIIDGNYGRTLEMRLKACDTVFLLDYPLDVCLAGAMERVGKKREEMPWIEEELDEEFRQWILDFPDAQLPRIYQLLEQYKDGRQIYVLHSREEADAWFEKREGNELTDNVDRLHTTEMGAERIRKNLGLADTDVVKWCRSRILDQNAAIERQGKNWYVRIDDYVITVNSRSCTIITAHREK